MALDEAQLCRRTIGVCGLARTSAGADTFRGIPVVDNSRDARKAFPVYYNLTCNKQEKGDGDDVFKCTGNRHEVAAY